MYKIYIENLFIEAIIGVLDFERVEPQPIIADCEIEYEKSADKFLDYAEVVSIIETTIISQKYVLLEDALEEIMEIFVERFGEIKSVRLKLSKPSVMDNCSVGVELFRKF